MVVGRKFNDEAFESKDAGTAEPWIGSEYFSLAKGNLLFCVTLLLLLLVVYEDRLSASKLESGVNIG